MQDGNLKSKTILNFIRKIQPKPLIVRKMIFWSVLVLLAIILAFFWFRSVQKRFSSFKTLPGQGFHPSKIELPRTELPTEFPTELLKELFQQYNAENSRGTTTQ